MTIPDVEGLPWPEGDVGGLKDNASRADRLASTLMSRRGSLMSLGRSATGWIGTASGAFDVATRSVARDLSVNTVSGEVLVDAADAGVKAKTVSGDVNLGAVSRGEVSLYTVSGDGLVGVRSGTRVWMDLSSMSGSTRSELDVSAGSGSGRSDLQVRATAVSGDILVRSAPQGEPQPEGHGGSRAPVML